MTTLHDNASFAASKISIATGRLIAAYGDAKVAAMSGQETSVRRWRQFALEKIQEAEAHLKEAKELLSDEPVNVVQLKQTAE